MHEADVQDMTSAESLATLAARGDVLLIGGDEAAADSLRERGGAVRVVETDAAESLDLATEFAERQFGSILFLGALERVADPQRLLNGAAKLLAEDGYVIASVANVTHASIRLALLRGNIEKVLNGRRRVFDRRGIGELVERAGLTIDDVLRVTSPTEIQPEYPEDVIRFVTSDPDSSTSEFVVVARRTEATNLESQGGLLERLQQERDQLRRALEEKADDISALRRDLSVKDAYIAELRAQVLPPGMGAVSGRSFRNDLTALVYRVAPAVDAKLYRIRPLHSLARALFGVARKLSQRRRP